MPKTVTITQDHLHVLLDAARELTDAIDREETSPWQEYAAGTQDDPKADQDTYLGLLGAATEALTAALETDAAVLIDAGAPVPYAFDARPPATRQDTRTVYVDQDNRECLVVFEGRDDLGFRPYTGPEGIRVAFLGPDPTQEYGWREPQALRAVRLLDR